MKNISRGIYADSATTLAAGLLGNMGLNMSSSCMALSVTTGISSRYIIYPFAFFFIALAFCPKVSLIVLYMPRPVIAATLIYLGTALLINSTATLAPLVQSTKQRYVIGVGFMFGFSYQIYPAFYSKLPHALHSFTGSALAVATVIALLFNLLLTLKLKKKS